MAADTVLHGAIHGHKGVSRPGRAGHIGMAVLIDGHRQAGVFRLAPKIGGIIEDGIDNKRVVAVVCRDLETHQGHVAGFISCVSCCAACLSQ